MGILARMDTACCGCSVRSVALFLLYFSLVWAILAFSGNSSAQGGETKKELRKLIAQITNESPDSPDTIKYTDALYSSFSSYQHIGQIISLVIVAITIYGVHASRPAFMIPYLVYNGVLLIIMAACIVIILVIVLIAIIVAKAPVLIFLILTVVFGLMFALCYYLYIIIYNAYRQIKEQRHPSGVITYAA